MMRRVISILALVLTLLVAAPVFAQDEAGVFWMATVETPVWAVILLVVLGVGGLLGALGMAFAMRGMATPEIVRTLAAQGQLIFQSVPVEKLDRWLDARAIDAKKTDTPVDDIAVAGGRVARNVVYGQGGEPMMYKPTINTGNMTEEEGREAAQSFAQNLAEFGLASDKETPGA